MSKVYHWKMRTSRKASYDTKIKNMLKKAKAGEHVAENDLTAIKMHFGEDGNTGYIQPIWVAPVVAFLKKCGAKPFITDANTLYIGQRAESVSHTLQAERHGFASVVTGAPVIIADGIKSNNQTVVPYDGKHIKEAYIAGDIANADSMFVLSHFKGHMMAGFGGALKNLGMGCATRQGKLHQHSGMGPLVTREKCKGCGSCVTACKGGALHLDEENLIVFEAEKCIGCAACILACRTGGMEVDWRTEIPMFLERMMEYSASVIKSVAKPIFYINIIMNTTPDCDCDNHSDAPICPDLGILCSFDPVALDQACADLVNAAPPSPGSRLPGDLVAGGDKFKALHPHVPWERQLEYAAEIGLGSREYEIVEV